MFGNKFRHTATAAKNTITVYGTTDIFFIFSEHILILQNSKVCNFFKEVFIFVFEPIFDQ
jgi:hypothetical protein